MLTEDCINCDADVPLSGAVHVLVNPKGDENVRDGYLCRSCYEEHVEPLLPDESADAEDADRSDDAEDRDDRTVKEA